MPAGVPVPAKGDFKTQLQNLLQTRHEPMPEYRVLREVGPEHQKIWIVEASMGDRARATGKGPTKKDAEQKAARQILALIRAMDRGVPRAPIGTRHGPR